MMMHDNDENMMLEVTPCLFTRFLIVQQCQQAIRHVLLPVGSMYMIRHSQWMHCPPNQQSLSVFLHKSVLSGPSDQARKDLTVSLALGQILDVRALAHCPS